MHQPLRIFVSSPSDVREERLRAQLIIAKLARDYAAVVRLVPYLWESEPQRATGHFQDNIELPSTHDIVVMVLWSRLGTALPAQTSVREYKGLDGRVPVTGTEWEFEEALASYRKRNAPDLLVYRRSGDPGASLTNDVLRAEQERQWSALQDFWRRHFEDKGEFLAASGNYDSLEEFDAKLERDLVKLIEKRVAERAGWDVRDLQLKIAPYRGLAAYDFADAPVFFGRDGAVRTCLTRLMSAADHGTGFLLVLGASGAGKSSLARAGLLPALVAAKAVPGIGLWRRVVFRPGDAAGAPLDAFAAALLGGDRRTGEGLPEVAGSRGDANELLRHLRASAEDASFVFRTALRAVADAERGQKAMLPHEEARLVVLVDQLEELFTRTGLDAADRIAFVRVLAGLARSGTAWVIATMRSDLWHRAAEIPELLALTEDGARFDILPPTAAETLEMIRRPARAVGLGFEEDKETGLALDAVLGGAAAAEAGALPLLSVLLEDLYRRDVLDGAAGAYRRLTFAAYRALGELRGAIATRAETVWRDLEASDAEAAAALPTVLRMVVTSNGETFTSRVAALDDAAPGSPARRLVERLIDPRARLLTIEGDDGPPEIRLAHEALIEHWPRARKHVESDRRDIETRARLEGFLRGYERAARREKSGALLTGLPLEEGIDLSRRWRLAPTAPLGSFIATSVLRRNARRRTGYIVAAALVALFGGIAGLAGLKWREADAQGIAARANAEDSRRQTILAKRETERANQRTDEAEKAEREAEHQRRLAEAEKARADDNRRLAERQTQSARAAERKAQAGRAAAAAREALLLEDPLLASSIISRALKAGAPLDWRTAPDLARALIETNRNLHFEAAFKGSFLRAALSEDGTTIGLLSRETVTFRHIATGTVLGSPRAVGGMLPPIERIDPKSAEWAGEPIKNRADLILSSAGAYAVVNAPGRLVVVARDAASIRRELHCDVTIGALFFLDDSRLLMACGSSVEVSDAKDGRVLYKFDLGDDWDESPAENKQPLVGPPSIKTIVDHAPGRRWLATPREIRNSDDGRIVFAFRPGPRRIQSAASVTFSPDGAYLAVDDNGLKTWDLDHKKQTPFKADDRGYATFITRDKQIITLDITGSSLRENDFVDPGETSRSNNKYTWALTSENEGRLLSGLSPIKDHLEYTDGLYASTADTLIFTAHQNLLNHGFGAAVIRHDSNFRVFRGEPESPVRFRSSSPKGLFVTRDDDYVYVWQSQTPDEKIDVSSSPNPPSPDYANNAGVIIRDRRICIRPDECRSFVPGAYVKALTDGRVESLTITGPKVKLTDEEGRELASFDAPSDDENREGDILGLTDDGSCAAVYTKTASGGKTSRRVMIRRISGDEVIADLALTEESSSAPDRILGTQVFIMEPSRWTRIDCRTGLRSTSGGGADITRTASGTYIKVLHRGPIPADQMEGPPTSVDIYTTDRFEFKRTFSLDGDPATLASIDVDRTGQRYCRGAEIRAMSDNSLLAKLDDEYDICQFLPGRSEIIGMKGTGAFGANPRFALYDGATYQKITVYDETVDTSKVVTFGPKREFVVPGSDVAYKIPNLDREAERSIEVSDKVSMPAAQDRGSER